VAAIRECFEEAGVLLARHVDGDVVRFDEPDVAARFELERTAVHDGQRALVDLCTDEGLVLTAGDIHYVSHWITPVGEARRFDTRFFVARAPQAQEPLHDDGETIESLWVRPIDALDRFRSGDLGMFPPTVRNLEFLEAHDTADGRGDVVDDAAGDLAEHRGGRAVAVDGHRRARVAARPTAGSSGDLAEQRHVDLVGERLAAALAEQRRTTRRART
jgi:8-oxo-dGTP pyrophosphatase MutT (NUDIX family)